MNGYQGSYQKVSLFQSAGLALSTGIVRGSGITKPSSTTTHSPNKIHLIIKPYEPRHAINSLTIALMMLNITASLEAYSRRFYFFLRFFYCQNNSLSFFPRFQTGRKTTKPMVIWPQTPTSLLGKCRPLPHIYEPSS